MATDYKALKAGVDLRQHIASLMGQPDETGSTWTWPCPFHNETTTGGFHVYKDGYRCFSCGAYGDMFDFDAFWQKKPLADVLRSLDPVEMSERATENALRAAQELEAKIQQAQAALAELRSARRWEYYHEQMTREASQLWRARGVPEWYQDMASFGYDPDHIVMYKKEQYHTPTLTIPIFAPVSRDCLNIRHRLLNPPDQDAGNKYRPERTGLGAHLFLADPDKAIAGKTLVVEGEIKAAVVFATADDPELQVVGLPGKTPKAELLDQLAGAGTLYVCLDPDADKDAQSIAKKYGGRVIRLPVKIDDYIVANDLGKSWVRDIMAQARKA
jgi:hypothetical protein